MRTWFDIEREKTFTAAFMGFSFLSLVGGYISVGFLKGAFIPVFVMYVLSVIAYIGMQKYIDSYSIPFCALFFFAAVGLGYYSTYEKSLYFSAAIVAAILFLSSVIKFAVIKIIGEDEERNNAVRNIIAVLSAGILLLTSAPFGDAALSLIYKYRFKPVEAVGLEYYESGEFANFEYGDIAFEMLPKEETLKGALSTDFAYRDYSKFETVFFEVNTQYFLKVEYGEEEYEKVKAEANRKDSFPEFIGSMTYKGCLVEEKELAYGRKAHSVVCYDDATKTVIYAVIIDCADIRGCVNYLHTEDTECFSNPIWNE